MSRIVPFIIALVVVLSVIMYDIFKTGRYRRPRQIILAIVGALLLVYILFTCKSDN
jgi:hypothetical protein